jgi:hypothetical protein
MPHSLYFWNPMDRRLVVDGNINLLFYGETVIV